MQQGQKPGTPRVKTLERGQKLIRGIFRHYSESFVSHRRDSLYSAGQQVPLMLPDAICDVPAYYAGAP